jgi:MFS family permease
MDDPEPQRDRTSEAPGATAEPAATPRGARSALLIVFLVVFIDLLGFGIVLPLLPLYGNELLEPLFPGLERAGLRGAVLGLLMSSFSAMQFLFAPVWGRVSDRVGRRPILLLGLAGSVGFYGLFGLASQWGLNGRPALGLTLLFIARLGAGVAGATISTAQAVIADSTPPDRRARGMALIGAAFGIGFTFGPLLGYASLLVEDAGGRPFDAAPGLLAAGISLVALVLAYLRLPETWRPGTGYGRRHWFDFPGLARALRSPAVGLLITTFFLATLAFGSLESTLALVNRLLLGDESASARLTRAAATTTERQNFLVFAYVGLILMLTQGLLYRRLVPRVGEVRFLRAGVVLLALGLVGAVGVLFVRHEFAGRPSLLVSALAVMTAAVIGFALLTPSVQSLISRRTDPRRQGEILGVNQSAAAMARILGPFLGIQLFYLTPKHTVPFACGAALLALVFLLTLRIRADQESP